MSSMLFDSSTLPLLEQVVNFTQARHGVLAGNIANLDTPGYRTRDLSPEMFQERLKEAIEERHKLAASARTPYPYSAASLQPSSSNSPEDPLAAVKDTMQGILRHDDNNTSLEEQVSEIAKNQSQHNLALSLMTAQFRLLRAAITERA